MVEKMWLKYWNHHSQRYEIIGIVLGTGQRHKKSRPSEILARLRVENTDQRLAGCSEVGLERGASLLRSPFVLVGVNRSSHALVK